MEVILDEATINQNHNGNITGNICIKFENQYFPEENWSDFPIIILGWWINSFLQVIKKRAVQFEFCFMDGPFSIFGKMVEEGMYELNFLEQIGGVRKVMFIHTVSEKQIYVMLMKTCRKVFRIVEIQKIAAENVVGIRKLYIELKNSSL